MFSRPLAPTEKILMRYDPTAKLTLYPPTPWLWKAAILSSSPVRGKFANELESKRPCSPPPSSPALLAEKVDELETLSLPAALDPSLLSSDFGPCEANEPVLELNKLATKRKAAKQSKPKKKRRAYGYGRDEVIKASDIILPDELFDDTEILPVQFKWDPEVRRKAQADRRKRAKGKAKAAKPGTENDSVSVCVTSIDSASPKKVTEPNLGPLNCDLKDLSNTSSKPTVEKSSSAVRDSKKKATKGKQVARMCTALKPKEVVDSKCNSPIVEFGKPNSPTVQKSSCTALKTKEKEDNGNKENVCPLTQRETIPSPVAKSNFPTDSLEELPYSYQVPILDASNASSCAEEAEIVLPTTKSNVKPSILDKRVDFNVLELISTLPADIETRVFWKSLVAPAAQNDWELLVADVVAYGFRPAGNFAKVLRKHAAAIDSNQLSILRQMQQSTEATVNGKADAQRLVLLKWSDGSFSFVDSEVANERCPRNMITFYRYAAAQLKNKNIPK